jgi:hypothetical protein
MSSGGFKAVKTGVSFDPATRRESRAGAFRLLARLQEKSISRDRVPGQCPHFIVKPNKALRGFFPRVGIQNPPARGLAAPSQFLAGAADRLT